MTIGEYKDRLRRLLESGGATDAHWDEVLSGALIRSEVHGTPLIDAAVENMTLSVREARRRICRICEKPTVMSHEIESAVTTNFGKEHAHSRCVKAES